MALQTQPQPPAQPHLNKLSSKKLQGVTKIIAVLTVFLILYIYLRGYGKLMNWIDESPLINYWLLGMIFISFAIFAVWKWKPLSPTFVGTATIVGAVLLLILGYMWWMNPELISRKEKKGATTSSKQTTSTSSNNSSAVQTKSSPFFLTEVHPGDTYLFKKYDSTFVWNRQILPTFFSPVQRGRTIKILQQNITHPSIHWIYYAVRGMDGKVTDWIDVDRKSNTDNLDPGMYRAILLSEDAEISISNDPEKR